jgi:hypothetical protein
MDLPQIEARFRPRMAGDLRLHPVGTACCSIPLFYADIILGSAESSSGGYRNLSPGGSPVPPSENDDLADEPPLHVRQQLYVYKIYLLFYK